MRNDLVGFLFITGLMLLLAVPSYLGWYSGYEVFKTRREAYEEKKAAIELKANDLRCCDFTVEYVEPTIPQWEIDRGIKLQYTKIYWCIGLGCTDWQLFIKEKKPEYIYSKDGKGGKQRSVDMKLDLYEYRYKWVTNLLRIKVVAVDNDGRESSGAFSQIPF